MAASSLSDRSNVRELAELAETKMAEGPFSFCGRWSNRVEVVEYRDAQFAMTDAVLNAMQISPDKSKRTKTELRKKGIGLGRTSVAKPTTERKSAS